MVGLVSAAASYSEPAIVDAMASVPREEFVPSFFLYDDGRYRLLRQGTDEWLIAAYQDQSLTTQLDGALHADDAEAGTPVQGTPTCSASQPSLVARMLDMLTVEAGDRVLEIGTGTGYNAALLCEMTGSPNVYSIEYDPIIAEKAIRHLGAAGYRPTVVVGDGGLGHREQAPYEAIITTCSFPVIHAAWLEQIWPDRGVVVANLVTGIPVGILLSLTITGTKTAVGEIVSQRAWFMGSLAEPSNEALRLSSQAAKRNDPASSRTTDLRWPDVQNTDGLFVLTALLLDAALLISFTEEGGTQHALYSLDGSVAIEQSGHVKQSGPRQLWDELEEIGTTWSTLGHPAREDFEISVAFANGRTLPTVVHRVSGWTAPAVGITAPETTSE